MSYEASTTDERTVGSRYGLAVLMLLVLVLGYPLSIGPANLVYVKLGLSGTGFGRVMEVFYRPISAYQASSPNNLLSTALHQWVELWERLGILF